MKEQVETLTGQKIAIEIKQIQDFRNYKVTWNKAKTVLGYEPKHTVSDIIADIHKHRDEYGDFEEDSYYNIRTFKNLAL